MLLDIANKINNLINDHFQQTVLPYCNKEHIIITRLFNQKLPHTINENCLLMDMTEF